MSDACPDRDGTFRTKTFLTDGDSQPRSYPLSCAFSILPVLDLGHEVANQVKRPLLAVFLYPLLGENIALLA